MWYAQTKCDELAPEAAIADGSLGIGVVIFGFRLGLFLGRKLDRFPGSLFSPSFASPGAAKMVSTVKNLRSFHEANFSAALLFYLERLCGVHFHLLVLLQY